MKLKPTQMFVWSGPISMDPDLYTKRLTLEWSPSRRGPNKKPVPKSESDTKGHEVLRLVWLCCL